MDTIIKIITDNLTTPIIMQCLTNFHNNSVIKINKGTIKADINILYHQDFRKSSCKDFQILIITKSI